MDDINCFVYNDNIWKVIAKSYEESFNIVHTEVVLYSTSQIR